jgi:hypothetical protein
MAFVVVLLVLILLAVLAPRYGVDSRDLRDHPWEARPDTAPPRRASPGSAAAPVPGQRGRRSSTGPATRW